MPGRTCLRTIVRGRVQGVGFRAWTQQQARRHELDGWVRNLRDGSVEAFFAGPQDRIDLMLTALCDGPAGSRVQAVEHFPATEADIGDPAGDGFAIRGTA
jgi:acylphosphatase